MDIKADESMALTKDTLHLPPSAYAIGSTDILVQTLLKEFPKTSRRARRITLLEEIACDLDYVLSVFAKDKKKYTPAQKQGFLERKYRVCQNIKKLQAMHIKMLIKELEIV